MNNSLLIEKQVLVWNKISFYNPIAVVPCLEVGRFLPGKDDLPPHNKILKEAGRE